MARQENRTNSEGELEEDSSETTEEMDRLTEAMTMMMQAQEQREQLHRERMEQAGSYHERWQLYSTKARVQAKNA